MEPILKINLTTKEIEEYVIPESWESDFLGGASLAADDFLAICRAGG